MLGLWLKCAWLVVGACLACGWCVFGVGVGLVCGCLCVFVVGLCLVSCVCGWRGLGLVLYVCGWRGLGWLLLGVDSSLTSYDSF